MRFANKKYIHLRDEEILTDYIDGKISEMEAIRRIMMKVGCDIATAKFRLTRDIETLSA